MPKTKARAKKQRPNQTALHQAAIKIGMALGKATNAARSLEESGPRTKKELAQLKKSLGGLVREVERATERVKKALR